MLTLDVASFTSITVFIVISLGARQSRHFPCHIPFVSQHMLHRILSVFSVQLFMRSRTVHRQMALCPPNWTEIDKADKRMGTAKLTLLICERFFMLWRLPSFPQKKNKYCDLKVDSTFLFMISHL